MKRLVIGLLADVVCWVALVFFSYAAGYPYVSIVVGVFAVLYTGWCLMILYGWSTTDPSYSDDDYEEGDDPEEPRNNDYDDRDPLLRDHYLTDEDLAELERERDYAQQLSDDIEFKA